MDKHTRAVVLRGSSRYRWTVCIAARACAESSFFTAPKGWNSAEWIAGRQLRSPTLPIAAKTVKSAAVAVTGLGFYELRLNGVKVGDAELVRETEQIRRPRRP